MKLGNDPTYLIVRAMLDRGNSPGLLREWFTGLLTWAEANKGPDASALRAWLPMAKPRPFYTAGELATMWPAFKLALGLATRMSEPPSANRLANELKFHGLPVLRNSEGFGGFYQLGVSRSFGEYFIVERCHYWRRLELTQEEFEKVIYDA